MLVTLILSVVLMAGLFLLLYAGVGLIQDNRFFSSAPKGVLEVIEQKPERFKGAHALGYFLAIVSFLSFLFAAIYGAYDGAQHGYTFWQFFTRYLIMLLLLKVFDILFFDLFLLCHSNFFPYFYPEAKHLVGPQNFGFNYKSHIFQIALCFVVSLILAWLATLVF